MAALLALGPGSAPTPNQAQTQGAHFDEASEPRGRAERRAGNQVHQIYARLDEGEHQLTGQLRLTWTNTSPRATDELWFHLYMNAFRAMDTPWMDAARGSHRMVSATRSQLGYIEIEQLNVRPTRGSGEAGPTAVLRSKESRDGTLLKVELDRPLAAGARIELELSFKTQLPRVFARTGHAGNFHAVGQWYPKIAVLDRTGTWQAHAFGLHSEFFADFGTYEVVLDLPRDFEVLSTGGPAPTEVPSFEVPTPADDTRKHHYLRAESVHDFVWFAGEDLVVESRQHLGVEIRAGLPASQGPRHGEVLELQGRIMDALAHRFGPYPWSELSVIVPPESAPGAAGMEYATAFTTSLDHTQGLQPIYGWVPYGRYTTFHESAHLYFQGLVATDEHRFPWMDEGFASYAAWLAYLDVYGESNAPAFQVFGHSLSLLDYHRLRLLRNRPVVAINTPADQFPARPKLFAGTVYDRAMLALASLRNLFGAGRWDQAIRSYVQQFAFRHPSPIQFRNHLIDQLGAHPRVWADANDSSSESIEVNLAELFESIFDRPFTLDFRTTTILHVPPTDHQGWHRDESGERTWTSTDPPSQSTPESVIVIDRAGTLAYPVRYTVVDANGDRSLHIWDGRGRYHRRVFPNREVRAVAIDPGHEVVLESHRLNNTRVLPNTEATMLAAGLENDKLAPGFGTIVRSGLTAFWGSTWP